MPVIGGNAANLPVILTTDPLEKERRLVSPDPQWTVAGQNQFNGMAAKRLPEAPHPGVAAVVTGEADKFVHMFFCDHIQILSLEDSKFSLDKYISILVYQFL